MTGAKLQQERLRAGLSQSGLARLSGVHIQVIQSYEQGRKQISADRFCKLIEALNMEIKSKWTK